MMLGKEFARRAKEALEARDMTYRELAERIGVSDVRMCRIMSGEQLPNQMELDNITKVLQMPEMKVVRMPKTVDGKSYEGVKCVWLEPLMRALDPEMFVRVLRYRNEMDGSLVVIFDGEAGEFAERTMKGFDQAAVASIVLRPDPDTVGDVLEITLARN